MKKMIFYFMFLNVMICSAQISQSIVNKDKFEKSGFPFKGERVLMVDHISASNEENYFVFSKNAKNSDQDELYIEQFTKENDKWILKVSDIIAEEGIVTSTWGARKAFADIDKDGKADVILVISKHQKGNMDNQLEVVQVLFYKQQLYLISTKANTNYTEDIFSNNFEKLPKELKDYALQFWNRLDKTP